MRFGTYQVVVVLNLRIFDYRISMLDLAAVPHIWMLYLQISTMAL